MSGKGARLPTLEKAIRTRRGPLILLFYDGYELRAAEDLSGFAYAQGWRVARYVVRTLRRQQVWTGFYTAFRLLRLSLLQAGCDVRVNNFALARRYPNYPIGMAGYPTVLDAVDLPNPVIFGPGDYGLPDAAAAIAAQPKFRKLIQPSDWAVDLYRATCGDKMVAWPVGLDTDQWGDFSAHAKDTDVLIYDKIRWDRDTEVPRVLDHVLQHLDAQGRSYKVVRYGHHHHSEFASALKRSRAMIFLCEHETQGLACQEALSSNIPVLAWDEGALVDPILKPFAPPGLVTSSVPYFDSRCGERFKAQDFETGFTSFWHGVEASRYRPRQFILDTLSLPRSAENYLSLYGSLM
jgi:hypothetical protein